MYLGLADYYVSSSQKEDIINDLIHTNWKGDADQIVSDLLENIAKNNEIPDSQAALHKDFIEQWEGVQSVSDFKEILINYPEKDTWIQNGEKSFLSGSPSSAHIIFRQLEQGKDLTLEEVFQSELNLSGQCCIHPDFAEGVRALLVDKDQSPKWQPATLEEITEEWVNSYFKKTEHP